MRIWAIALLTLAGAVALPANAWATGVLTVERVVVGPGDGVVQSTDGLINCPPTCSSTWGASRTYTLMAIAAQGSAVVAWSGCDAVSGPNCTILVEHAPDVLEDGVIVPRLNRETVTVTFAAVHRLTVRRGGAGAGTVASSPAAISCGDACEATLVFGTPVTLTATPEPGSFFAGWEGDCSGTGACTVALDRGRHVIALFGRVMTGRRLRASPGRPAAGRLWTLRLALDGDPVALSTSCRATIAGRRVRVVARLATARLLVCRWRIPLRARGRMLRARVEATDAHADVQRRFSARVR